MLRIFNSQKIQAVKRSAARREWMSVAHGVGNVVLHIFYGSCDVRPYLYLAVAKVQIQSHTFSQKFYPCLASAIRNGSAKNIQKKFFWITYQGRSTQGFLSRLFSLYQRNH